MYDSHMFVSYSSNAISLQREPLWAPGLMPGKNLNDAIHTLCQGTNISHLGKRIIIFKSALVGDMLLLRRVSVYKFYILYQHLGYMWGTLTSGTPGETHPKILKSSRT